jgi:putative transposase
VKYAWIRDHAAEYPVALQCRILAVSRSGYYEWRLRKPSKRQERRAVIAEKAVVFHARSNGVYGYRKVFHDIVEEAKVTCCRETVRKIMREKGLVSKVKRRFVRTTDSRHSLPVAQNRLARDFSATAPDQKWVADITYIRTMEGWLYLAGIMDLYSRRIVGWAMSDRIDTQLVSQALNMALHHRQPSPGLLHHSDRGVQYAADDFQAILTRCGIECSMSRKGNCWDNACQESFFGKLKAEHIRDRVYATREEARLDVFWYIEVFYNRMRRHAALGYVAPVEFEACGIKEVAA